jgi:hypothetical protein
LCKELERLEGKRYSALLKSTWISRAVVRLLPLQRGAPFRYQLKLLFGKIATEWDCSPIEAKKFGTFYDTIQRKVVFKPDGEGAKRKPTPKGLAKLKRLGSGLSFKGCDAFVDHKQSALLPFDDDGNYCLNNTEDFCAGLVAQLEHLKRFTSDEAYSGLLEKIETTGVTLKEFREGVPRASQGKFNISFGSFTFIL